MCGIAGFVGSANPDALKAMANALIHRGPDDEGLLANATDGVHLAHRRLAILDVAGGRQPMCSDDGAISIVFNGEIYNFVALRRELESAGLRFRSDHSDTEVLLLGWRHWGMPMFDRLNGMWALAIHDRANRELILARDRFGKKPLYYHPGRTTFAFASELHALRMHPETPVTWSRLAIQKYYAYGFIPAPHCLLEGVSKLPAGHVLRLDLAGNHIRIKRWWQYQPSPEPEMLQRSTDDLAEEFLSLLDAAVARRLIADVPVGAFLSGGIDSSTIAALAMKHLGADRLNTYSIAFADSQFDESSYARQVAAHLGARHQVDTCTARDLYDALPNILARLDEPMADASLLPSYLLCKYARREVTVALGGDGADELLAGYDPFRALRYARTYQRMVPTMMHRAIQTVIARLPVSHRYMSLDFKLKRTLRGMGALPSLWLPMWMSPLTPAELSELINEPADPESIYSEAITAWERCPDANDVDRSICFYVDIYLQDDILTKVDRASMMNSLEVRSPFLDIEVVNLLRRLPSSLKLRGSTSKWLLRVATRRILPRNIIDRSKQGFAVPVGRWFQDGSLPLKSSTSALPFWQSQLAEHRAGKADHRLSLWSQLVLDAANRPLSGNTP